MNILKKADGIVNQRSEEKNRQYGSFNESMDKMRDIFNAMTGLQLDTKHMYQAMIALKLSREAHAHKEDNLLDAVAYMGAMNNYLEGNEVSKQLEFDFSGSVKKAEIETAEEIQD